MKQCVVWVADDGTQFATEDECIKYEQNKKLRDGVNLIVQDYIGHNLDSISLEYASLYDLGKFIGDCIVSSWDKLSNLSNMPINIDYTTPDKDGWYSNIGNNTTRCLDPYVVGNTWIYAVLRNGDELRDYARNFRNSWCETDKHPRDIIKYKILT